MPTLKLFGKRTFVNGDDLRTPSKFILLFRILQLVLGIYFLVSTINQATFDSDNDGEVDTKECEIDGLLKPVTVNHGHNFLISYGGFSVALAIASIAAVIPTYIISGRGTPTDVDPRKALPFICYINITLFNAFRLIAFLLGILSIIIIKDYCDCARESLEPEEVEELRETCPDATKYVLAICVITGIDFAVAFGICTFYICWNLSSYMPAMVSGEKTWSVLCRCCLGCFSLATCCVFGGKEAVAGDFGAFTLALNTLFKSDGIVDVAPSDIMAALKLVRRTQKAAQLESEEHLHMSTIRARATFDSVDSSTSSYIGKGKIPSTRSKNSTRSKSAASVLDGPTESTRSHNSSLFNSERRVQSSSGGIYGIHEMDEAVLKRKFKLLSNENSRDVYCMAEAARFMPYAHAAYTWIMYCIDRPFSGFIRLVILILTECACFKKFHKDRIEGDYWWKAHTVTLKAISGLQDEDIVYASFKESIEAPPYFIALDHDWKTVVLSIRGTLSLESTIADIAMNPIELTDLGREFGFNGAGQYCHSGMLVCSEWIYRDLKRHGKLVELFAAGSTYSGYRLRVVGHSLGAGVANVLSLFLRSQYPNVRCLAFSPPGSLLSKGLTEEAAKWTTSFVLDSDVIPRLSIESIHCLRDEILETICRIKIPKYQIIGTTKKQLRSRNTLEQANKKVLCDPDKSCDSEFKRQVEHFFEYQKQLKAGNPLMFVHLYPPGEIIQLIRTMDRDETAYSASSSRVLRRAQRKKYKYTAVWIEAHDLDKIILSKDLMFDHQPLHVSNNFQDCASTYFGVPRPYNITQSSAILPSSSTRANNTRVTIANPENMPAIHNSANDTQNIDSTVNPSTTRSRNHRVTIAVATAEHALSDNDEDDGNEDDDSAVFSA